ncbi:unnamed protein product [Cylicocyclus nassatus]|uniref:Uncharacterized protein n=1 Tax=Cylicocyclus nassatus TaxID=53992 RepID=A0AA36H0E0_CYLNA|nr:unnamed protein product [Cylicocyclus nassatus]
MNLVCILLAIAPLSFANINIVPFSAWTRIFSFFSGISKSYDRTCGAKARNLLNALDETRQTTPCLVFNLTEPQQKEDPVTVLEMSKDAITGGFESEKFVGCAWDPEAIICVFGNNSCNT